MQSSSFDGPTTLGLIGGISLPLGVGMILGPGWALIVFGLESLIVAVLTTTTRR